MGIHIGSEVTDECQPLDKAVVRLYGLNDAKELTEPSEMPFKWKIPRESKKQDYIDYEVEQGIQICETENFAKKWTPLRMKVKLLPPCPWFQHEAAIFKVFYNYSESTTPFDGVTSITSNNFPEWGTETIYTGSFNSVNIGDPFSRGSAGIGSFNLSIENNEDDNTITIIATLSSLGLPYDFLEGTPVVQTRVMPCPSFIGGQATGGFWTGVKTRFPGDPLGLVMSLDWTVQGGQGYTG